MSWRTVFAWVACVVLVLYQFFRFDVLQDDAFISYRYIGNFLDGQGLVFNVGERVEGYTNFFWIIFLAFLTKLGLPLIETARWAGVLAACGTLGVALYAARRFYPERGWFWALAVPFLLAVNGSLAYWAGSGLETALFTLLLAASAAAYFSRSHLALLFLALATLTRPEGGLLALLFGLAGVLLKRKRWKETLVFWATLALLLLPFAVFKYSYYGSLLPNPFYAKTGFSPEYWQSGLAYAGLFLKHYGGYGLFLILPLLFWKKLTAFSRFSLLTFLGYTLYLICIGGDVLKAHRFFVPALFFFYLPAADGLFQLLPKGRIKNLTFTTTVLLAGLYGYTLPSSYLKKSARLEAALVGRMKKAALYFSQNQTARSFAVTTIGAFSYHLGSRRVIDMLGLAEPRVARNPERVEGLKASWKERHFNARYVLSQKPEVILFSTGVKPSAPAEKALFLYPDFRRNYRLELAYQDGWWENYYRRFQDLPVPTHRDVSPNVAEFFNKAMNFVLVERNYPQGVAVLRQLLGEGPRDCPAFFTALGFAYLWGDRPVPESSGVYLKKGMELDKGGTMSRFHLAYYFVQQKRYAEAREQFSILSRAIPTAAEVFRQAKLPTE